MKINCEIIQDLIPSYVEEICSNASKQCVEEHIADCKECNQLVELYKKSDFSADSLEQKELDGFRKLKKKVKLQSILSYGLLLLLIAFGVYHFESDYKQVYQVVYYVFFAISIIASDVVTIHQQVREKCNKQEKILSIISFIAIVSEIFICYYFVINIVNDKIPFGLERSKVGPLLYGIIRLLFLFQIAIFGYHFYIFVKKNIVSNLLITLNLLGIFLTFAYTSWFGNLSDISIVLYGFFKITGGMLVLGVIGIVVQYVIKKKIHNNDL